MSPTTARRYRRALAWLGFITLYLIIPALAIFAVYYVSTLGVTYYDRESYCSANREACDPYYADR